MKITVPLVEEGKLIVGQGIAQIHFIIKDGEDSKKAEFSLLKEDCAKFAKMLLAISEEGR